MTSHPAGAKLDAYFDGELSSEEARPVQEHLRECASCAAEGLAKLQQKLVVRAAGQKFTPDAAFRARLQKSIAPPQQVWWKRAWLPLLATASMLFITVAFLMNLNQQQKSRQQTLSELTDQHVATLASANPVDVVSTDRHTVKPWFAGKIPFTFNLPELQGSPFTLVGGKLTYLNQSPGAELIFKVRQHQISVFIFQEAALKSAPTANTALSFQVRSWKQNGLQYFAIGDAGGGDLEKLSDLLKAAG